jgi:glycosyltransferase involved in cell wall biosynthesis
LKTRSSTSEPLSEKSHNVPRVSVLMVARNTEAYINEAIASIVQQTFSDWELIAIDDGSDDGTFAQMQSWCGRDHRIKAYRHRINQGLGVVRRQSLELASAPYAAVLDSDDVAESDWLARHVAVLDNRPTVVAISSARVLIDEHGRKVGLHSESDPPEVVRWRLLFGNPVSHSSSVFRIQAAKEAGGYGIADCAEDWALFQRLARLGEILLDDKAAVRFRLHASSQTRSGFNSRSNIESHVAHCISEQCSFELGLKCPAELGWYLFRERPPFPGSRSLADSAVEFVLKTAALFLRRDECVQPSSRLASAIIADIANVRRCSPRGIVQLAGDARRVWDLFRPTQFDPRVAIALLKLASTPIRAYQARIMARRQRFAN